MTIIGRTGSGKSTIFLSLTRLIEICESGNTDVKNKSKGEIIYDGIPITPLALHKLRSNISILPQTTYIFPSTVKLNLDPMNKYSVEEIRKKLPEFIFENLEPLKMDSIISDGNLSQGQKQVICLGRVLLERRKIVLVDEGTSNIDEGLEEKVREVLENWEGVTVIAIAHRLRDPRNDVDVKQQ